MKEKKPHSHENGCPKWGQFNEDIINYHIYQCVKYAVRPTCCYWCCMCVCAVQSISQRRQKYNIFFLVPITKFSNTHKKHNYSMCTVPYTTYHGTYQQGVFDFLSFTSFLSLNFVLTSFLWFLLTNQFTYLIICNTQSAEKKFKFPSLCWNSGVNKIVRLLSICAGSRNG